jgi:predicted small lipoprotein YifL
MMRRLPESQPVRSRSIPVLPAPWRVALVCGVIALGVAGCGRKGPLEPPPAAAGKASTDPMRNDQMEDDGAESSDGAGGAGSGSGQLLPSVSPGGHKKPKPIVAPKRPFILDPIL